MSVSSSSTPVRQCNDILVLENKEKKNHNSEHNLSSNTQRLEWHLEGASHNYLKKA